MRGSRVAVIHVRPCRLPVTVQRGHSIGSVANSVDGVVLRLTHTEGAGGWGDRRWRAGGDRDILRAEPCTAIGGAVRVPETPRLCAVRDLDKFDRFTINRATLKAGEPT